jgi:DNA-binding CsgD family transcriptional regulator
MMLGLLRSFANARSGHCVKQYKHLSESLVLIPYPYSPAQDAAMDRLADHLQLTRRQAEVLHWVAEGKTNMEISIILSCSFFTVKNHLKVIFLHLGVSSRTGAAACAYRVLIAAANARTKAAKAAKAVP